MKRIGVVGAGVGAAAAAFAIASADEPATLTVLEKSGGLCGRAATRRRDDLVYDYGANYVKSDDERVVSLLTETIETDGLVDIEAPVWTFDREGTVSEGREADEHKWTYRQGLTQIAKRLFARTDAEIHRRTRVETITRSGEAWELEDTDGGHWGPFDVLIMNPPAPQTATLLETADWNTAVRDDLLEAVQAVPYRTIWTGIFHYPFELDRPYYALVNTDKDHEVGWIAREECKAGHVPAGESLLVVQANHEWSVERYAEPAERNLEELATLTASVVGEDRLTDPDWTDHQGWRLALPEAGVDRAPLERAEGDGLYCLGDWITGEPRLHAAIRTGLEGGNRIISERQ